MKTLLKPLISTVLCGCLLLGVNQVATASSHMQTTQKVVSDQKISILSTLLAKTGDIQKTTHGYRLILMNVDPRMLWFADRPKRLAGFTATASFIASWKRYFKTSNPNAALVHVRLASRNGFAEVPMAIEISNPLLLDGTTLVFDMKPLSRHVTLGAIKLPVLFIDNVVTTATKAAEATTSSIPSDVVGSAASVNNPLYSPSKGFVMPSGLTAKEQSQVTNSQQGSLNTAMNKDAAKAVSKSFSGAGKDSSPSGGALEDDDSDIVNSGASSESALSSELENDIATQYNSASSDSSSVVSSGGSLSGGDDADDGAASDTADSDLGDILDAASDVI